VPLPALLAKALELAPVGKFLYSSGASGLPEPCTWGPRCSEPRCPACWPPAFPRIFYSERTVARLIRMICADDATRAYRLGGQM
jgi:hypothetical protein